LRSLECVKVVAGLCVCLFLAGCATKPAPVTPKLALDYGRFVLRQAPPEIDPTALKGRRIVIDPGHGGAFSGAVGPNNLAEADVNLGVGLYLWGMLTEAGAEAHLTRVSDAVVYQGDDLTLKKDLQARAEFSQAHDADLFISLHHNADVDPEAKKNSLETYFKMSDPGPSLDIARCIHRQLAITLAQTDNAILPGNFHVLRENSTTAILGEPSYISHADNAFRLGLAPMQRIEAQAYFLGIAEYFSKGVPTIEDIEPEGTVRDSARPLFTARVTADRGVAIDPGSITMSVDGEPVAAEFDPATSRIAYMPAERLSNGRHRVSIALRNMNGNAARPIEGEIDVAMPPGYILVDSAFPAMRIGSATPIPVRARVFDVDLTPVADGTPVSFNAVGGAISPSSVLTRNGEAIAYVMPRKGAAADIEVIGEAAGLKHSLVLKASDSAPDIVAAKVVDASTNSPIALALAVTAGRTLGYADRAGYFAIARRQLGDSPITFSGRGYKPERIDVRGATGVQMVRLQPIAGGVLFGQRFALDPEFGGEEKGARGPTGLRASDLNADVANHLARLLRDSGAEVVITRTDDETATALHRVEAAEAFGAQWFISIGHGEKSAPDDADLDRMAPKLTVLHYPTSELGQQLATALSTALQSRRIIENVTVEPTAAFVLTHTSSPAVIVRFPSPSMPETEDIYRRPDAARNEAYALYCGILHNLGLTEELTGHVTVMVTDNTGAGVSGAQVRVDGTLTMETRPDGGFKFSNLTPGAHRIDIYADGAFVEGRDVTVEAGMAAGVTVSLAR
jgi:N-acetylmuramoyl-L-alanine amidase